MQDSNPEISGSVIARRSVTSSLDGRLRWMSIRILLHVEPRPWSAAPLGKPWRRFGCSLPSRETPSMIS